MYCIPGLCFDYVPIQLYAGLSCGVTFIIGSINPSEFCAFVCNFGETGVKFHQGPYFLIVIFLKAQKLAGNITSFQPSVCVYVCKVL